MRKALQHRHNLLLVIWVAALSFFVTSGTLGSGDAGEQFRQADSLVRNGRLWNDRAQSHLWQPGTDGHLYEVHDPGNTILMLPAAAVDAVRHPSAEPDLPDHFSAFLVSMTYALFATAALLALLFALTDQLENQRAALVALLLFVFGTAYATYEKTAWDVLGGCLSTCLALGAIVAVRRRSERGEPVSLMAVALGASIALTAAFRITWAPFLVLALATFLILARLSDLRRIVAWGLGSLLLFSLPQLVYNGVRTGSPLRPHTASIERATGSLGGSIPSGFVEHLASPKFGLLVYCPIFLLFLIAAVHRNKRWPTWPAVGAVLLYTVLLGAVTIKPGTTWGPRYLVPALPLLFFALAPGARDLLVRRRTRPLASAVILISVLFSAVSLLIPWHDDLDTWHGGRAVHAARWSFDRAELAADGLGAGISGDRVGSGFELVHGEDIAEGQGFPEFWWMSAIKKGGAAAAGGLLGALLLVGILLVTSVLLFARSEQPWIGRPG
jgi:hypothetical protein